MIISSPELELSGDVTQYQRIDIIGSGTYGRVYKAIDMKTQNYVAVKKTLEDILDNGIPPSILREITIARSLEHENIVRI